jgi:hypothetical protein
MSEWEYRMATLATQVAPHTGLAVAFSAATSGGDKCATGSGLVLLVKNGDSGSHTVTLATPETVDALAVDDRPVSVAAGAQQAIPVPDLYRDPSDGLAHITYDAVTSVTVAALRVP